MTKIIYFSATGNSLFTAKKIAESLDAELISLNRAPLTLEDDKIGFVFPVYCGDLPFNLKEYLLKVNIKSGYIFSVSISGGTPLRAQPSLCSILSKKGIRLSYYADLKLTDNSIVFSPKDIKEINADAEIKIDKIINDLKSNTYKAPPKSKLYFKSYAKIMWIWFKWFYGLNKRAVDTQKCSKCSQCVKLCPKQNIGLKNGDITFSDNCVYCFACIHWCPNHAISFGKLKVDDKTAYHHEGISINDIIEGNKKQ